MTRHDRAALKLAVEQARAEDAGRDEQIRRMLRDDGWEEAATFAAYHCQIHALHLKPWEEPPCAADEGGPDERDKEAQRLLRQMLALGVSRWHPDPLAAIEAAKQRKAAV
jgi:hypothetical protein